MIQYKHKNLLQLNFAVIMLAGTAMFSKGIDLPVTHVICFRSLIAALFLAFLCRFMGNPLKIIGQKNAWFMMISGVLLCLHWLTYFASLRLTTAAVALLSLHTYPILTAIVEPLVYREKIQRADIFLVILVFTGIGMMTPEINLSNETTQGILLGILSGVFFMIRNLMTRKIIKNYSSKTIMFWQTLVTGCLLLPVLSFFEWPIYTGSTIGLLVLLGVVFTAMAQSLLAGSLKSLSAKTVGILSTMMPFYGALFGYLIHKESINLQTIIGGGLILVCVLVETLKTVKSKDSTQMLSPSLDVPK